MNIQCVQQSGLVVTTFVSNRMKAPSVIGVSCDFDTVADRSIQAEEIKGCT